MIRTIDTPIEEQYKLPTQQTPGRREGLVSFAASLDRRFGPILKRWIILDVGGGDGWLRAFIDCDRYYCLDPIVPLEAVAHGIDRAIQGRAEHIPFPDKHFDLVVSKQTLPHFDDPALACREMVRVARHAVVVRQEFPERPIGWPGHSRVTIDGPEDIMPHLGPACTYDGTDFVILV